VRGADFLGLEVIGLIPATPIGPLSAANSAYGSPVCVGVAVFDFEFLGVAVAGHQLDSVGEDFGGCAVPGHFAATFCRIGIEFEYVAARFESNPIASTKGL
jgi:hypothetical protein